jgi:hypothetical protein
MIHRRFLSQDVHIESIETEKRRFIRRSALSFSEFTCHATKSIHRRRGRNDRTLNPGSPGCPHDLTVISVEGARRKEREARREMLNSADLVILCLPDDAAREAVFLIENTKVRVIDASSAHRTADG